MKLGNTPVRILFGLVAGPAALWLLWMGGWWRAGFFTFVLGGATWEYFRILRSRYPAGGTDPEMVLPVLAAALGWLSTSGPLASHAGSRDLLLVLSISWILIHAFRRLPREEVFPWAAKASIGILYTGIWGSALYSLCAGRGGGWESIRSLLFALLACWIGDTAAFAAGKAIGRHKLCPELSPGKTIEGALAAVLVGTAFGAWYVPEFLGAQIWMGATLGGLVAVAGIVGDLAESVFKRWAGVKDSSNLFPGHGGILDRFDSLLLAAPLVQSVFQAWRH